MARSEKPLERDGTPHRELAFWLRDMRSMANLTYQQLATRSSYSVSTLQEACSGRRMPSLNVVLAFARGCGEPEEPWRAYWQQLRRAAESGGPLPSAPSRRAVSHSGGGADQAQGTGAVADTGRADADHDGETVEGRTVERHFLRPRAWAAAGVAVLTVITVIAVTGWFGFHGQHRSPAPVGVNAVQSSVGVRAELEFNRHGAPTFQDPYGVAGSGPKIGFRQWVMVVCKVYAPSIASVKPDGYWYRIATAPWNGRYYASANTFLNGDPPSGPYSHNTDFTVKTC